jgi:hypothetical protein
MMRSRNAAARRGGCEGRMTDASTGQADGSFPNPAAITRQGTQQQLLRLAWEFGSKEWNALSCYLGFIEKYERSDYHLQRLCCFFSGNYAH